MRKSSKEADTLVANIDTSRLSRLVSHSERSHLRPLLDLFQRGDLHLVLCLPRILELASLPPIVRREMVAFFEDVPTLIGQPEDTLEADELRNGCLKASGKPPGRAPRAFARGTEDWGVGANAIGGTAADLLRLYDPRSPEALALKALGPAHLTLAQPVGVDAAIVKDRQVHLRNELQRHLVDMRGHDPDYAHGLSAQMIVERSGGLAGFPSFEVAAELVAARFQAQRLEANDLMDEQIAKYHPYAAVSVLDRATKNRFWQASIRGRERVTSELSDVTDIVRRVVDGELEVFDHFVPAPSA